MSALKSASTYCEDFLSELSFHNMSFIAGDDDGASQHGQEPGATTEPPSMPDAGSAAPAEDGAAEQPAKSAEPDPNAEPGSPENPLEISDPRALRALAHPARLSILQHLVLDGPATATECAEVAGLSPSACSYHLRALARYGFVDEDPSGGPDRPHRPGRARVVASTVGSDPGREVNPSAVAVMAEAGIDITGAYPKAWTEDVLRAADVIITMGCGDACPIFPGKRYEDWELPDPAGLSVEQVRPTRDEIGDRVRKLIAELGLTPRA